MVTLEQGGEATVLLSMSHALLLREYSMCGGKNTRNYTQYFLNLVLFNLCTSCILRCLVCVVVSCLVCIVVSCLVCIVVSCLVCIVVSCRVYCC